MKEDDSKKSVLFDEYSDNYESVLNQSISVSGENKDYFARGRIVWLVKILRRMSFQTDRVLDFGCGTGSAAPFVQELLKPEQFVGVDVSARSIQVARQKYHSAKNNFYLTNEFNEPLSFDLAFCNGVFHHIPPVERADALNYIFGNLRSGGVFAFWENNPWNPGTTYIMKHTPFDKDAIVINPLSAQKLLKENGFEILRTDFLFFFPRFLGFLRPIEIYLNKIPFGAQYLVLCRKP